MPRNPHDHGTVGIIIGADIIDPDTVNVDHLDPLAGRLLHMIALNRSGGARLAMTPYTILAGQLSCDTDQLRTALHQIADAGHGHATYDTLTITTWQPDRSARRRAA